MITQELIQFIQQSISQGKTKEEIRNMLLANGGWQESDIEEAFSKAGNNGKKKKSFKWVVVLLVLAALGFGGYFVVNEFHLLNPNPNNWELHMEDLSDFSTPAEDEILESEVASCNGFPDKLDTCEPFSCEFTHPLTGETTERRIVGLVDGICQYVEEMPNNGQMSCDYTDNMRKEVAQYYREVEPTYDTEINISINVGDDTSVVANGAEEVPNPLLGALITGVCVVTGYEEEVQEDYISPGLTINNISDDLRSRQVRFVSPENNIQAAFGETVVLAIQTGDAVESVDLQITGINPDIFYSDVNIPVVNGIAEYSFQISDHTLWPVNVFAKGKSSDIQKDSQELMNAPEEEMLDTMRTINIYTNQTIESFSLKNDSDQTILMQTGGSKPAPHFVVNFFGYENIPISSADIDFTFTTSGIVNVLERPTGTVFIGAQSGQTDVVATYAGKETSLNIIVQ